MPKPQATEALADVAIEQHPLAPFIPAHAQLLMLGSFPPQPHRWRMNFYYPNYQNDMWRIFGWVFFDDKNYFLDVKQQSFQLDKIIAFLTERGIAIYDTAEQIQRQKNNAADQFLHIVKATNIEHLLQKIPDCYSIMTTGDKATATLMQNLPIGSITPTLQQPGQAIVKQRPINLYRLPSTSRAYPLALEKKAAIYREFFERIGLL